MQPNSNPPAPPAVSRRGLYVAGLSTLLVAMLIVVFGVTTRKVADAKLREWTEDQAVPVVAVALPEARNRISKLDLPGRLEAYTQAQMYARVSGYVKDWKVDIGAPVKTGELLAVIDAPDLDQQIMQAEANLASAKANSVLADATLKRGQYLITTYAISQQDLDQRSATPRTSRAWCAPRKPTSTACACSNSISGWWRRSTAWSRRAQPTSVR